jgi:hypothetical protein
MNTQFEDRDVNESQAYDPFPEPRTLPSGWDLSGLLSAPEPDPVSESESAPDAHN